MEDVDTVNTQISTNPLDDLKGREKIIINASLEEFISNPIEILRKNIYLCKFKEKLIASDGENEV